MRELDHLLLANRFDALDLEGPASDQDDGGAEEDGQPSSATAAASKAPRR